MYPWRVITTCFVLILCCFFKTWSCEIPRAYNTHGIELNLTPDCFNLNRFFKDRPCELWYGKQRWVTAGYSPIRYKEISGSAFNSYIGWFAKVFIVFTRCKGYTKNSRRACFSGRKLEHLMKGNICKPYITTIIDCQSMWHIESEKWTSRTVTCQEMRWQGKFTIQLLGSSMQVMEMVSYTGQWQWSS